MIEPRELPEPETQAGVVADAPAGNWVDRYAPAPWRPYLRLSRADRPIGTWLLLLPCFWGLTLAAMVDGYRAVDLWLAVSASVGAFVMRGAGCTWNDITDRHIDASVARTRSRPLPSGQVSLRGAVVWMGVQAAVGAVILFSYNLLAIGLGVGSLLLVAVYPFAKRFTWWPQVFLGLAFNWGALLLYAAHSGTITLQALLLYAGGIAWTLYYDTIYACQDKEDDALIGVKSTARLFGDRTRLWLWRFMVLAVVLVGAAIVSLPLPPSGLVSMLVGLFGVWAFGWHMALQMRRLREDDPASCVAVFRANRDAGGVLALFLAVAVLL